MKTLAWDTSTVRSAVALVHVEDGAARCAARDVSESEGRHAEVLLPRVEALLVDAGWDKREVALVAVGIGPGSFTGLRVGLAAAKGWALAMGVPLFGVPSHAAIAGALFAERPDRPVAVVTDAFKGEVYVTLFRTPQDVGGSDGSEVFHAEPGAAAARLTSMLPASELTLVGDGLRRYMPVFEGAFGGRARMAEAVADVPCPVTLARLAAAGLASVGPSDLRALVPIYVRGSDATLPKTPLAL